MSTKAKSWEPASSQALIQNKIDRKQVRSRESGRQTVRRPWCMVSGIEIGREVGRRGWIRIGFVEEQCFQFGVKELCKDSKRWGFGEFVVWVRYLLNNSCFGVNGIQQNIRTFQTAKDQKVVVTVLQQFSECQQGFAISNELRTNSRLGCKHEPSFWTLMETLDVTRYSHTESVPNGLPSASNHKSHSVWVSLYWDTKQISSFSVNATSLSLWNCRLIPHASWLPWAAS